MKDSSHIINVDPTNYLCLNNIVHIGKKETWNSYTSNWETNMQFFRKKYWNQYAKFFFLKILISLISWDWIFQCTCMYYEDDILVSRLYNTFMPIILVHNKILYFYKIQAIHLGVQLGLCDTNHCNDHLRFLYFSLSFYINNKNIIV